MTGSDGSCSGGEASLTPGILSVAPPSDHRTVSESHNTCTRSTGPSSTAIVLPPTIHMTLQKKCQALRGIFPPRLTKEQLESIINPSEPKPMTASQTDLDAQRLPSATPTNSTAYFHNSSAATSISLLSTTTAILESTNCKHDHSRTRANEFVMQRHHRWLLILES